MHKTISAALLTTAVAVIPVSSAFAAGHTAAKSLATKPVVSKSYSGPSVNMQWGPVQVTVVVRGKTVVDITATAPNERARSAYINSIAVPMLRKEVLQAKSVAGIKNIYGISGATMTSEAFYQSLLAALHTAHLV